MGDLVVNAEIKYHIVRKDGDKEVSQRHIKKDISMGTIDELTFSIISFLVEWFLRDPEILLGDGD